MSNQLDWPNDGRDLQQISILERHRPLTGLDVYLNFANTRRVSGMPSEIHEQPSKINRSRGKRSAKSQSPLQSGDNKLPDSLQNGSDHIYTEAISDYLLPKPVHATPTQKRSLPTVPTRLPRKQDDQIEVPQPKLRPRGDVSATSIFSKWLMKKNMGTV